MARIIIVEDDLGQKEELQSFLMHTGHQVLAVSDGATLERSLEYFSPEIALLDYNLPGESGAVLAGRLRERFGSNVGLVMVTARSMASDRIESRLAGVDNYLVKPIDFSELIALIDNLIARLTPAASNEEEEAWRLVPTRSELIPPGMPPIPLTGWELLLLQALANAENLRADRDTLIFALGKNPLVYDPRALEANISRLRRKLPRLKDGRSPLQPMRAMGYQFIRPLKIMN